MHQKPEPAERAQPEKPEPHLLPYEPPRVQSVKLSDDAAESLT
ncbi:MAG TPA: hypothetical protein VK081_12240 [Planctomycetota bacterium]|nr:hypothetical protein [Planctomycetota bacterium]